MADRFDIKPGDRIAYTDPHGHNKSISGRVDQIMDDASGAPVVAIIECDDGGWATLNLREVSIRPLREALN